jgi:hypothetical protein
MYLLSRDYFTDRAIEIFESKFKKGDENECWEWQGQKDKDGYGKVAFRTKGKRYYIRAHRMSAALYIKPYYSDKVVMHHCDNPSCVNPNHLKIGTHLENEQDKDRKGRRPLDHIIKYGEDITRGIFEKLLKGWRTIDIKTYYGISKEACEGIISMRNYSNSFRYRIFNEFSKKEQDIINDNLCNRGERSASSILNNKDVLSIRAMGIMGVPSTKIAKKYNIGTNHVRRIWYRERWKHLENPECYYQSACAIYTYGGGCEGKCSGYIF